jgi:hypothetical protein
MEFPSWIPFSSQSERLITVIRAFLPEFEFSQFCYIIVSVQLNMSLKGSDSLATPEN